MSAGIHSNMFDVLCIGNEYVINNKSSHLHIPITLTGNNQSVNTATLIDSGATANFISKNIFQEHHIQTHDLPSTAMHDYHSQSVNTQNKFCSQRQI